MTKGYLISIILLMFVLSACGNQVKENKNNEKINNSQKTTISESDFFEEHEGKIEHVHGLGYAGNQNSIFFASHDGLKVYQNGNWYRTKENNNDYMGFNASDEGFYTSGHPGEGVNLKNPFGLSKSNDNGETLQILDLEGESDFHAMGVGYENHIVYVLNGQRNSKMDVGLYVTENDGENWKQIKATNLGDKIFSIAVHPTNKKIIAISSEEGIFFSKDEGENFSLITSDMQGTSVFFSEDTLWYGAYGKEPVLIKYNISNEATENVTLPEMKQDAIMYLAQNPKNDSEVVFITFNGDVYITNDGTKTWDKLVSGGNIK